MSEINGVKIEVSSGIPPEVAQAAYSDAVSGAMKEAREHSGRSTLHR